MSNLKQIVNFLFETGILAKTPRSGFHFLGTGDQTVAEHINRVVFIGYTLAYLDGSVDIAKVLKMCLFHDLPEARTSDLNYLHQKYAVAQPDRAVEDLAAQVPFGADLKTILDEYEQRQSPEAKLAKDADQLEWILSLKEQLDTGNERARDWIMIAIKRLQTELARSVVDEVMKTDSTEWWLSDKGDSWWVTRNNGR